MDGSWQLGFLWSPLSEHEVTEQLKDKRTSTVATPNPVAPTKKHRTKSS